MKNWGCKWYSDKPTENMYSCTNGQCIIDKDGTFSDKETCEKSCVKPTPPPTPSVGPACGTCKGCVSNWGWGNVCDNNETKAYCLQQKSWNPKIGYYSPLGTRYQNWNNANIVDSNGKNTLLNIDKNIQSIVTNTGRQPILYSDVKGIDMPADQR